MKGQPPVDLLLDLIEPRLRGFKSDPDLAPRHFAAAGLMRCCALLRGMVALQNADLEFIAGILARQHWETCLVSLHAVLRGKEALEEIGGDDIYWKRRLDKSLSLGLPYHPDWDGPVGQLNFRSLAERLTPLLRNAGEPDMPSGLTSYDVVYKVQSLFSTHAGLATIGAHIVYAATRWGLDPRLRPAVEGVLWTATAHTAHLAKYVFPAFEHDASFLDPIWERLLPANAAGAGAAPEHA